MNERPEQRLAGSASLRAPPRDANGAARGLLGANANAARTLGSLALASRETKHNIDFGRTRMMEALGRVLAELEASPANAPAVLRGFLESDDPVREAVFSLLLRRRDVVEKLVFSSIGREHSRTGI